MEPPPDADDPMADQPWPPAVNSLLDGAEDETNTASEAGPAPGHNNLGSIANGTIATEDAEDNDDVEDDVDILVSDIMGNIESKIDKDKQPPPQVEPKPDSGLSNMDVDQPDLEAAGDDDDDEDMTYEQETQEPEDNFDEELKDSQQTYASAESSSDSISRPSPKLFPIEVVVPAVADPESYAILPPSETVDRILEKVEVDDQAFFSVEYTDGRIEQVAYDDLLQRERGPRALEQFVSDSRFNLRNQSGFNMPYSHRQAQPEDEYEDSDGSEADFPFARPKRATARPTRRSSRNASRQASADIGPSTRQTRGNHERDELHEDEEASSPDSKPKNDNTARQSSSSKGIRVSRSQNPFLKSFNLEDSADELSQIINGISESDGEDWFLASDINPKKRKTKKRHSQRLKKIVRREQATRNDDRDGERDSSIEFEPSRRSRRTNRSGRSMRDPDMEDEFHVAEERGPAVSKIAAVKELFRNIPVEDPFRDTHTSTCESCQGRENNGRGMFVFCQGCSYTYHKGCIGLRAQREHRVTKVADDEFVLQCRYCIGSFSKKDARAPNHALCEVCHKAGASCHEFSPKRTPKQEEKLREQNDGKDPITKVPPGLVNNSKNVLFRCTTCHRAFHHSHLPPRGSTTSDDAQNDRLRDYKDDWKCKECFHSNHKIQTLVAWRPAKVSSYKNGQDHSSYREQDMEFLVKWEGRSHFHDTWMPGAWVAGVAASGTRSAFYKRDATALPKMDLKSAIEEEWILPDIIFEVKYRHEIRARGKAEERGFINEIKSVHLKFQGLAYDEAVWDEPPPRDSVWGDAPWEAFQDAFAEYLNGKHFAHIPESKLRDRIAKYRTLNFETDCELQEQPVFLKRGELMPYQLEGVNWLLYKFHQQENVILADEMGLGKTVQIVAFLATLALHQPKCWPFLVVVPNATCPNWRREIKKWVPELRVVTYHGGKVAQQLAWDYELFPYGKSDGMRAHIVIMSFEAATNMKAQFGTSTKWSGLIVDEGQRLKNEDSLLYRALSDMRFPCRILLTGTPLQNNKRELFNLLQFIDPSKDAEALDLKYAELNKDNLPELHDLIRPYFLRRTKAQVLTFLPAMGQIILPVSMSVLQEKLCKTIMSRNAELLQAIVSKSKMKASERKSLSNILMELRQCLCHPFCFNADVEDKTVDPEQMHRNLVAASGKLMLLNVMLPKLQERGHRVLIFSQFLHSLTILEDFLTGLGLEHLRIDGSISALEKQRRIDAYNAPDSPYFAMLLSTRAGGVGINLATADTVIIYDPDFNPHQDIQALSRAHRIGQKKKVLCFQLTTKNTAEEKIMQVGRKKMALDHALIESMDAADDAGGDLESILKHGASALFGDTNEDKIVYDSASIDKLLDRSNIETTKTGNNENSTENQFSFARVWQNDKDQLVENDDTAESPEADLDATVWENILRERQEEHERELAAKKQEYGRGARRKAAAAVRYDKHVGYEDLSDNEDMVLTVQQQRPEDGDVMSDMDVDQDYSDADANDEDDYDSETSRVRTASGTPAKSQDEMPPLQKSSKSLPPAVKAQASQPSQPQTRKPLPGATRSSQLPQTHHQNQRQYQQHQQQVRPPPQAFAQPPQSKPSYWVAFQNPRQPLATMTSAPPVKEQPPKKKNMSAQERIMDEMGTPNVHIAFYLSMTRKRVCVACGGKHPVATSCIDFNSEVSLRLAIDGYRTYLYGEEFSNQLLKGFLRSRLLEVIHGKAAEARNVAMVVD